MEQEMLKDLKETCFKLMMRALDEQGLCVVNKEYKTMITITSDTTARISLIATNNEWEAEFKFDTMTCLVELMAIGA